MTKQSAHPTVTTEHVMSYATVKMEIVSIYIRDVKHYPNVLNFMVSFRIYQLIFTNQKIQASN